MRTQHGILSLPLITQCSLSLSLSVCVGRFNISCLTVYDNRWRQPQQPPGLSTKLSHQAAPTLSLSLSPILSLCCPTLLHTHSHSA